MTDYISKHTRSEMKIQFPQPLGNELFFKTSGYWHWMVFGASFGAIIMVAIALPMFFDIAERNSPSFIVCLGTGLIIRPKQFDAFKAALRAAYVRQMVEHLQVRFSKECRSQGYNSYLLTDLVSQAINDADRYGVRQASDLQLYLECLALLGPTFDNETDWAASILSQTDLDGTAKMDAIHDHMVVKFANEYSTSEDV